MTNQAIISKLSELPVDTLERWRLTLANSHIALSTFESATLTRLSLEQMADQINDALAIKELNRLKGYDVQDANWTFV